MVFKYEIIEIFDEKWYKRSVIAGCSFYYNASTDPWEWRQIVNSILVKAY